jgi:hypothetical protein
VSCQIDRFDFDLVGKMSNLVASREIVRNVDICTPLDEFLSEERTDKPGTSRYQYILSAPIISHIRI